MRTETQRIQSALDDGECPSCHGSFHPKEGPCSCGYELETPVQLMIQELYDQNNFDTETYEKLMLASMRTW